MSQEARGKKDRLNQRNGEEFVALTLPLRTIKSTLHSRGNVLTYPSQLDLSSWGINNNLANTKLIPNSHNYDF